MTTAHSHEPDWVHGHPHEPNPPPADQDPTISLVAPTGVTLQLDITRLLDFPQCEVRDCYIVSTGHGRSGPFRFTGVRLLTLLQHCLHPSLPWHHVDLHSADNFGTRLTAEELNAEAEQRPSLLALRLDGEMLSREKGLVRLIVPSERDDALKQVKWLREIRVH